MDERHDYGADFHQLEEERMHLLLETLLTVHRSGLVAQALLLSVELGLKLQFEKEVAHAHQRTRHTV